MRIPFNSIFDAVKEYMKSDYCYFDLHPQYIDGMCQDVFREFVSKKYKRNRYSVSVARAVGRI